MHSDKKHLKRMLRCFLLRCFVILGSWSWRKFFCSLGDRKLDCIGISTTFCRTSQVVPFLSIRTCIEASISKDEGSDLVWRAVARFISDLDHLSYAERRTRSSGIDHDSVFASEVESV